jgi:uncharacterized membrane protein YdfJ with MMPL/SSD domain
MSAGLICYIILPAENTCEAIDMRLGPTEFIIIIVIIVVLFFVFKRRK